MIGWPFRRKRAPLDLRGLNEDWCVGDLAECVVEGWPAASVLNPKKGEVRRVCGIVEGQDVLGLHLVTALEFEGYPGDAWHCQGFRKLRPAVEPAEAGFTAWLRARLPRRTRETQGVEG